jgi:cardiolipin synthase
MIDAALIVGSFATIVLGFLTYLLLFERGATYSVGAAAHALDDAGRARLLTDLLAIPLERIDAFEVLSEGASMYDAYVAAIRGATQTVHLETYIFRPGAAADAVIDALSEAAGRGIRVRVTIDAIGSLGTSSRTFAALLAAGGAVQRYHPLRLENFRRWNNRTHRNLLVIDGAVGFIGGAGIADQWRRAQPAPWRDCVVRVEGPIARGLQAVFAENWLECAGELLVDRGAFPDALPARVEVSESTAVAAASVGGHSVPIAAAAGPIDARAGTLGIVVGSTPTAGRATRARTLIQLLLASAQRSIRLCTPYFVPDRGIRHEMLAARARGVAITVITGGPYVDHGITRRAGRRRYGALLENGVDIYEYARRMMHAKVLVIDERWVCLGSTNIDHRSFGLNDEVNLVACSDALAARLIAAFSIDRDHSARVDYQSWLRRPWGERILATLGRITERHQ